jgi:hypothetical protein
MNPNKVIIEKIYANRFMNSLANYNSDGMIHLSMTEIKQKNKWHLDEMREQLCAMFITGDKDVVNFHPFDMIDQVIGRDEVNITIEEQLENWY